MTSKYKPTQSQEGWIYADPLPTSEELQEFYAEKYYQEADHLASTYQNAYSPKELEHKHFEAKLCLSALELNLVKNLQEASILELGSGEGFFLKEISKKVGKFKGVDFSAYGVQKFFPELRNHFVKADIYKYISNIEEKYDAIVLRNVIEHVPNPINLLNSLKSKLQVGGIIVFSFPNDYSLIQELSKKMGYTEQDFWFTPPDHLFYFNTKTIKVLIENLGLITKDMFSIFPVDLFLLNPESHYINKKEVGKYAHKARMELELALWKNSPKDALNLFRQFSQNGIGREITVIVGVQ